jgi:hypothetical protein
LSNQASRWLAMNNFTIIKKNRWFEEQSLLTLLKSKARTRSDMCARRHTGISWVTTFFPFAASHCSIDPINIKVHSE